MFRVLVSALIVAALPSCAMTPPSSTFSSLSSYDGEPKTPSVAAPSSKKTQTAGISTSLGDWWSSVKSGFNGNDTASVNPAATGGPAFDPADAEKLVNAYRARKGLNPLKVNVKLNEAAHRHSADLAKSDRISHYGSDGSDAWDRVRKMGYNPRVTAENVGTGQQTLEEVLQGWQKSREHNANLLLGEAEEMGVAVVHDPKTQFKTFWTMVVASPRAPR